MAHYEPSHQDLHCHSSLILNDTPIWNNGSDHIQSWKSPLQKLRDERVKDLTQFMSVPQLEPASCPEPCWAETTYVLAACRPRLSDFYTCLSYPLMMMEDFVSCVSLIYELGLSLYSCPFVHCSQTSLMFSWKKRGVIKF